MSLGLFPMHGPLPFSFNDGNLRQLLDMGINEVAARKCLKKANNDIMVALDIYNNGEFLDVEIEPITPKPTAPKPAAGGSSAAPSKPAPSPATMSEEEQLNFAMELSKQQPPQASSSSSSSTSRASGHQAMIIDGVTSVSAEDAEMNRVVLESLQSAQYSGADPSHFMPDNPTLRVREDKAPVGLKNVGNTCYFNSLLQTYYQLPPLREQIMKFQCNLPANASPAQTAAFQFMQELQRLFALMEQGREKYCDPTNLFKKLLDRKGMPVQLGNQEDVSDFNELVLERISEGLALQSPNADFVKRTFYGKQVTVLRALEADGQACDQRSSNEYTSLILPTGPECGDLHSSFEHECAAQVDYTTPKGNRTRAEKVSWLETVPPVILFQENRVAYDAESKAYAKNNSPLKYEHEIFLDRYLIGNADETTKRRQTVRDLRQQLAEIRSRIRPFVNYSGKSVGLIDGLEVSRDFFNSEAQQNPTRAAELQLTILSIEAALRAQNGILAELRTSESRLVNLIDSAYADMRQRPYTLFAVWLHSGIPGAGHYWSYIRSSQTGKWLKYNDMRVTETDDATVDREAFGGHQSITASFLIYVERAAYEQFAKYPPVELPAHVKRDVETANAQFEESLRKYQAAKSGGGAGSKIDSLMRSLEGQRSDMDKRVKEIALRPTEPLTANITSFAMFLRCAGDTRRSDAELLRQLYFSTFNTPIEAGAEGDNKRLAQLLGDDVISAALNQAVDGDPRIRELQVQWEYYVEATMYLRQGLNMLSSNLIFECLTAFSAALRCERKRIPPPVLRENQLVPYIALAVQLLYDETKPRLTLGSRDELVSIIGRLYRAVMCAVLMLPSNHPVRVRLETDWPILQNKFPPQMHPELSVEKMRTKLLEDIPVFNTITKTEHSTNELEQAITSIAEATIKIRMQHRIAPTPSN